MGIRRAVPFFLDKAMIKKIPVKKIGMTSAFDGTGTTLPVTLLQPIPVVVTQIKRQETDGYSAVQVAYRETLEKRINKPTKGVLAKAGTDKVFSKFYEVRCSPEELEGIEVGMEVNPVDFMARWDQINVTGMSKGKGFAGAMKRHGFAGQQRTHGDPDNRRPQSNGATDAARVFKGSRRPGHMGHEQVTIKGLTIFEYDKDLNVIAVSGSVPGPNGGMLFVKRISERPADEIAAVEGEE